MIDPRYQRPPGQVPVNDSIFSRVNKREKKKLYRIAGEILKDNDKN